MEPYAMSKHLGQCFWLLVLLLGTGQSSPAAEKRDVVEGESVRLQCRFHAALVTPTTQSYWIRTNRDGKDNAAINEVALDVHYSVDFSPKEGKYDLIISRVQYNQDHGTFECKLKQAGSGADVYHVAYSLTVLIPPGAPRISPGKPVAREGETFAFTCISEGGSPDPEIQWYRDRTPLQSETQKGGSRDRPTSNTLEIKARMEDDGALYRCTVWNRAIREDMKLEATETLRVNYSPRVTVGPYNPLYVLASKDATLTCNVRANPPAHSIRWMKGGHILSNTVNHTITAVTLDDSGMYTCVADNGIAEATQISLELSVLYAPKISLLPEKEVSIGESISMKCNVAANPKPHLIQWLKEGNPYFHQRGDTLKLDKITAEDSGKYVCQASSTLNPSGAGAHQDATTNATIAINVRHKPGNAEILPSQPVAIANRPFTMTCRVHPVGWPLPEFRWWREGQEDEEASQRANYTIVSANVRHEGNYYCQPKNPLGHGSIASVYLTVHEPSVVLIPLRPQNQKKEGDTDFSLTCRGRGKPKPRVQWLHNDKEITEESGLFKITTKESLEDSNAYSVQSTLYFDGPARKGGTLISGDRGKYSCLFENGFGDPASTETVVQIKHAPIVRHSYNRVAFDLDETAILQCIMQAFPEPVFEWYFQNGPLEQYSLSNYGTNVTELGDDIYVGTLAIRDVKERDYGDYTCRAWNQVGDDKKTIIKLVHKSAPERPTNVEIVEVHSDKALLRWKEGFNGGYPNTEFLVTYTNLNTGESKNESCRAETTCHIIGLSSKTDYSFKVLAVNPRGPSLYSNEVATTTKVNLKDMPRVSEVVFNKDQQRLYFNMDPTTLQLIAKVEARSPLSDAWRLQKIHPVNNYEEHVHLPIPPEGFSDVRVALCLQANESWCGDRKLASPVQDISPKAQETQPTVAVHSMVIAVAIVGSLLLVAVGIVVCCCLRKKNAKCKKDYEDASCSTTKPPVAVPFYPDGMNKPTLETSTVDSLAKQNLYMSSLTDPNLNGHISPQANGMLYPVPPRTDSAGLPHEPSTQTSEMWAGMKGGGGESEGSSYHPYDPSAPNGYYYPEDYQPLNDEVMNLKNRGSGSGPTDHLHGPYYDVSGLPDPYAQNEEEKNHPMSLSFDESLESGYSTPNSRNRRVIREIIV